ncbi:MAG: hypothetical protein A2521_05835 [Deltaproteobacteria bacterium RIFOXYD12_FULL_57_12]|nr:MAG: hypothetical protein A2521_05835 [Deltaproteobacteria bacterium RIFOXYD12_FULL_57_12]
MEKKPVRRSANTFPAPDPAKPYVYPGTEVLINKFGIRNGPALERVAATLSMLRADMFRARPRPGAFDLEHLCAIHEYLFQDVLPWAGQLRLVDTEKNGSLFAPAAEIAARSRAVFALLEKEDFLQGLGRVAFIEKFAYYFAEVSRLRIFREGNGLAQRLFFEQLAIGTVFRLDFAKVAKSALHAAIHAANNGDLELLMALFEQVVSDVGDVWEPGEITCSPV